MNDFRLEQDDCNPFRQKNTEWYYPPKDDYKFYGISEMSQEEFLDRYRICFLKEVLSGDDSWL